MLAIFPWLKKIYIIITNRFELIAFIEVMHINDNFVKGKTQNIVFNHYSLVPPVEELSRKTKIFWIFNMFLIKFEA